MKIRARHLIIIVLMTLMVGADTSSCSSGSSTLTGDPNNVYVPGTNYCYTDPPAGCYAYCVNPGMVGFNAACYGPAQGPLEAEFENKVDTYVNGLPPNAPLCREMSSLGSYHATPCQFGITPQEFPNQDHSVCTPVPAGCPW
jgi:hypothetical protein